jgi:ADP-ribose pyrophosphatase
MKTVFEGDHLLVAERDGWQYVERKKGKEAAAVIAFTEKDELILTEQFRKPVNARVIDFPAGLIGDDGTDDPEATARKELEEEAGYTCDAVELVAKGPTSAGITSEIVSVYRAKGVRKSGIGGGVDGESITVHLVPREEVQKWVRDKERQGLMIDIKLAMYLS